MDGEEESGDIVGGFQPQSNHKHGVLTGENTNNILNVSDINNQINDLMNRGISVNMSSAAALSQVQQHQSSLVSGQQQQKCSQLNEGAFIAAADVPFQTYHNKKSNNSKRQRQNSLSWNSDTSDDDKQSNGLGNNRYSLLSDLDILSVPNSKAKSNVQKNVSSPDINTNSSNKGLDSVREVSHRFLPPIILFNVDIRALVAQFKLKFPSIEFKVVNSSNRKSKLFVKDYDAYVEIMALLKEKQISSHSYTPEQCKQLSLILRGVHYLTPPDEIKDELDNIIPGVVDSVHVFLTPYMKKNNVSSNLFRVNLLPGKGIKDILAIKYIAYQKVTWEKPKVFSRQVQCKRCQKWGHIAKNCNHKYQCVKCNESHEPGKCLLLKSTDSKPYCINCKQWGHPANFRGCEAFKSFAAYQISNNAIAHKEANQSNFISSGSNQFRKPSVSYASHFKNQNRPPGLNARNSKLINDFLLIAKQLFEEEPISIEDKIKNFLQNFKVMSLADKKAECFKLLQLLK